MSVLSFPSGAAPTRALRATRLVARLSVVCLLAAEGTAIAANVVPLITSQPHYTLVTAGNPASFSVAATSNLPIYYQWLRDGKSIPGATSNTYVLPTAAVSDSGAQFMVKITNAVGPAYSWNGQLVVMPRPGSTPASATAPVITKQPVYAVVVAGGAASFSVAASSASPISYQWLRNGAAIPGATATSYSVSSTALADTGAYYSVKMTNAVGPTWSWNAQLIVTQPAGPSSSMPAAPAAPTVPAISNAAPVITTQPQSSVVNGGQPATFAAAVGSSGLVTYQWLRSGVAIVGATGATYTIPAVQLADSGASFSLVATNSVGTATSAVARLTVNAARSNGATADRPFSDQSPWNSRPTKFTLGTTQLPQGAYLATLESGAYSVKPAVAAVTDAPATVYAPAGSDGIWVFDAETRVKQIVIPHWPANVQPATGTDGHADIIDVAANRIHSFFQLKQVGDQWIATDYSWAPLDGSGWGEPGHYNVGARATGVPPTAGLIRPSELIDGLPAYRHALAMSLPLIALSPSTPYVFPATSSDSPSVLKGSIPEGSLLMLPADFDLSRITDPRLLKVARTLQSFGAYVVDRNDATSFAIYVDAGASFKLMPDSGWDMNISNQLEALRAALRPVTAVSEWADANGAVFTPNRNLNLMSMRGMWYLMQGPVLGTFDSWSQSLVFPDNGQVTVQTNGSGTSMKPIVGTVPQGGQTYALAVKATGGATFRLQLWNAAGQVAFNSGALTDGTAMQFVWPVNAGKPFVTATSGSQGGGTVSASLILVK